MRFLFRALALVCLAVAVIFAVVDATRSIGASAVILTPLAESWDGVAPGTRAEAAAWLARTLHPVFADPVLEGVVAVPTFAVFALLALLLAMAGRPRRRRGPALGGSRDP